MGFKAVDYRTVPAEEVTEAGAVGAKVRWLITQRDGVTEFAMRYFEVTVGGSSPLHNHPYEHEVFILKGKCGITCDGRTEVVGTGGVILVPPDSVHQFKNLGNESLKFLCMIPYTD
jgi:quercetin dioxygenase-like cupin family protein